MSGREGKYAAKILLLRVARIVQSARSIVAIFSHRDEPSELVRFEDSA